MKTLSIKETSVSRKWYVVDAEGQILGRMASRVASLLRGKHKPIFTPHVDTGDHVVVINAQKVRLSGDKLRSKIYYHHSGYPGGLKYTTSGMLKSSKPERLVQFAIQGMLPKNKLGRAMIKKLRIYAGADHPHHAQRPEPLMASQRKG
ncbi:MAG: 50S ribosomal protein L13 [Nitrospiria bacterium]